MEERTLTCIRCPRGCTVTVTLDGEKVRVDCGANAGETVVHHVFVIDQPGEDFVGPVVYFTYKGNPFFFFVLKPHYIGFQHLRTLQRERQADFFFLFFGFGGTDQHT